ncbi:hypothetical protein F0562_001898 [Nyssa sinensis]|uniref:Stress-response A/B barrel domain-containing protein n=1 Tax=Nyssa sinensis TaxID=561372 RepID=A0A5J5C5W3_9ASTE|nr:hypothetical protein F0562_001898 [Nyssa sinensis]
MGRYRHILLLKFKDGVNVDESVKTLEKQAKENESIVSVEVECGQDITTPEVLRHGFTHIFMMTFNTTKDFSAYRSHPKNIKHSPTFSVAIADALTFNYEAVTVI